MNRQEKRNLPEWLYDKFHETERVKAAQFRDKELAF